MAINYFTEQVAKPRLKYRLIAKWLKYVIAKHSGIVSNISYIFCNDVYMLDLNNRYLNHDYYTDIITFDYGEGGVISGDIYISVERVSDNSMKYRVNLEDEFLRVIIHGVLHLLGHNDESDSEMEVMRNIETKYISEYKNFQNDGSLKV